MADVDEGIQALPQELQDKIFAFWHPIEPGEVEITKSYKPPIRFAISRAIRREAAKAHYGDDRVFTLRLKFCDGHGKTMGVKTAVADMRDLLVLWLRGVSKSERGTIKHIQVVVHESEFRKSAELVYGLDLQDTNRGLAVIKLELAPRMEQWLMASEALVLNEGTISMSYHEEEWEDISEDEDDFEEVEKAGE